MSSIKPVCCLQPVYFDIVSARGRAAVPPSSAELLWGMLESVSEGLRKLLRLVTSVSV